MTRVSPPELAREFPGPQASRRVTRAPCRRSWSAVQPPKAPAPTTAAWTPRPAPDSAAPAGASGDPGSVDPDSVDPDSFDPGSDGPQPAPSQPAAPAPAPASPVAMASRRETRRFVIEPRS